ncbi:hypothetical protein ZWY2020_048885 [Hordeum vulgare]|nr:hypothetical protein ZWY2020_048885 [Hordeum vulgare]
MDPVGLFLDVFLCFFLLCIVLLLVYMFCIACCGDSDEENNVVAGQRAAYASATVERRRPAAPVVKLGYFPYSMEGRGASEKLACAICLEVFAHQDICSKVPTCQHVFHRDCIDPWIKCNTTCPLCRVKC